MKITLNSSTVKSAESRTTPIEESGAYVGTLTRAEAVTAKTGSTGVDMSFVSTDNKIANYLSVWTNKADGTEIFGIGLIMSAMTCLKVKEIFTNTKTIQKWDSSSQCMADFEVELYMSLMDKPIGIVLQKEWQLDFNKELKYDKAGNPMFKFNVLGFFDAVTRLTASEILDGVKVPVALDRKLKSLKDKPLPVGAPKTVAPSDDGGFTVKAVEEIKRVIGSINDFDSDCPF